MCCAVYCTTIFKFYRKVQRDAHLEIQKSQDLHFLPAFHHQLFPLSHKKKTIQSSQTDRLPSLRRLTGRWSTLVMGFNWIIFIQSDSLVLVTVKKVSHRAWTWVAGIRKTKFPDFCEIFELALKRALWKSIWKMWTIFWPYLRDHKTGSTRKKACL